jgi:hypothetical protein
LDSSSLRSADTRRMIAAKIFVIFENSLCDVGAETVFESPAARVFKAFTQYFGLE